uniref:Uncharacterized protein n=2 Tax=Meloidogyne TaxID=189290 RepID=A0A915NQT0_9BILA
MIKIASKFLFPSHISQQHSKLPILFITIFYILIVMESSPLLTEGFVLQELPLYRSIRDTDVKATPLFIIKSQPKNDLFERKTRAFNFQRLNKLRNFWQRNEALKMALFPEQKFIYEF